MPKLIHIDIINAIEKKIANNQKSAIIAKKCGVSVSFVNKVKSKKHIKKEGYFFTWKDFQI